VTPSSPSPSTYQTIMALVLATVPLLTNTGLAALVAGLKATAWGRATGATMVEAVMVAAIVMVCRGPGGCSEGDYEGTREVGWRAASWAARPGQRLGEPVPRAGE
jgi:hypothetical protein